MRNKKTLALLLCSGMILGLTASHSYPSGKRVVTYKPIVRNSEPLPYDKWRFQIITPEYFPASISFVQFLDEDNYIVQKFMNDGANSDYRSVNTWNKRVGGVSDVIKNHGEALPLSLTVCWDSVIDKKSYQTLFKFTPDVRQLMREPSAGHLVKDRIFYRDRIFIGLAPGGTAKAWLRGYDKNNGDNILVATGESVYGDNMTICRDKTNHPDGYGEYSERIKNFIKGKKYPYGEW
ncbi:DUF2931 family protein [Xenorhabdus cabanillasii]|uniref:DUF2931 family protein n=1 Tax=Xenorhabdus cabanillasii TaxID=351673 RepID=A0A3D9UV15_9GAMM|nr:DUF2931 family protein [Xenorhabdus cabanillasii]REF28591.1 DUF2931 family protein [Xenorhabdus cabanillasii]